MNFSDNLKRLRKENNLNQEELADKLNVSRQSVSKWERGEVYPEMDKIVQIAKMFDVDINVLLNGDINDEIKNKDGSKYFNYLIDYINKTIKLISCMSKRDIFKCLIEQVILILIFAIFFHLFKNIIDSSLYNILSSGNIFYRIFSFVYSMTSIILTIILILHIFKVRYLDYYKIVDNKKEVEEVKDLETSAKETKVIIRDSKDSSNNFLSLLVKIFILIIKINAFFILIWAVFSLIFLIFMLVASFLFIKTGIMFIASLILLLSIVTLNIMALYILYNFIVNLKIKFKLVGIISLISIILIGISIGLISINVTSFDYINVDSGNKEYFTTTEKFLPMREDIFIHDNYNIKYQEEEEREDIRISITHYKKYNVEPEIDNNDIYFHYSYYDEESSMNIIREFINNINNKKLVEFDDYNITIYASKENLDIIKKNKDLY